MSEGLCEERKSIVKRVAYRTLTAFPREHWKLLRTNNMLERVNKEIRRRTRVVGAFPDGSSALMLVGARLRYVAGSKWGQKRYLNMSLLTAAAMPSGSDASASAQGRDKAQEQTA